MRWPSLLELLFWPNFTFRWFTISTHRWQKSCQFAATRLQNAETRASRQWIVSSKTLCSFHGWDNSAALTIQFLPASEIWNLIPRFHFVRFPYYLGLGDLGRKSGLYSDDYCRLQSNALDCEIRFGYFPSSSTSGEMASRSEVFTTLQAYIRSYVSFTLHSFTMTMTLVLTLTTTRDLWGEVTKCVASFLSLGMKLWGTVGKLNKRQGLHLLI